MATPKKSKSKATIPAAEILESIDRREPVVIANARIAGDLDCHAAADAVASKFSTAPIFEGATWLSGVRFSNATIADRPMGNPSGKQ